MPTTNDLKQIAITLGAEIGKITAQEYLEKNQELWWGPNSISNESLDRIHDAGIEWGTEEFGLLEKAAEIGFVREVTINLGGNPDCQHEWTNEGHYVSEDELGVRRSLERIEYHEHCKCCGLNRIRISDYEATYEIVWYREENKRG